MNLQNISVIFLILCVLSCKKIDSDGYRVYKIKEGSTGYSKALQKDADFNPPAASEPRFERVR